MATWAIKDDNGHVLPHFLGSSRIELGCKLVPARYDLFRPHMSASYRELFEHAPCSRSCSATDGGSLRSSLASPPFGRRTRHLLKAKMVASGGMRREWHEILLTDVKA